MSTLEIYTLGHSTRTIEEFLELLHAYHITHLVDVRTMPKSRRMPWFNDAVLAKTLAEEKIRYTPMRALGGLRKAQPNSINQGWHNASFRGYADYMQTESFAKALQALIELLEKESRVAIMCAEAVPWRCHRSLIADALLVREIQVYDILNLKKPYAHQLTAFAKVDKSDEQLRVYYPELVDKNEDSNV